MTTLRILAAALVLVAAGCIAPSDPNAPAGVRTPNAGGEMTAKETRDDSASLCTDGVNLGAADKFCAQRTLTVSGTLAGLSMLDVDITTFNGGIVVHAGPEGQWGFVSTLKARGSSMDDAKANLDKMTFEWSHEAAGSHFLSALAKKPTGDDAGGYSAAFDVTMPPSLVLSLIATTSNGNVEAKDVKTDGLSLHTSNGKLVVDAAATSVDIVTSNGAIDAKLRPTGSGRVSIVTSNGAISLKLPESSAQGYDVEGTTSNGEVKIALKDGQAGACPSGSQYYTPPCNHKTFRSSGFDARALQTFVTLTTSNGAITVDSA